MSKAQDKLQEAMKLIREAENLADESGETLYWDLFYGGGGTYYPVGADNPDWYSSGELEEGVWYSSSQQC